MPVFNIPIKFDIELFSKKYLELKIIKSIKNCKNALRWLQNRLKIRKITENKLKEIDKFLVEMRKKKFDDPESNLAPSTLNGYCGRIFTIFSVLFEYDFPEARSPNNYKYILNKSDDLESIDKIPRVLIQYSTSDPPLYKMILKFREYLEKTNHVVNYNTITLQNLRNSLIPMRDEFINQTVTRESIVKHIQDYENEKACTKIKTRNPTYETTSASYITQHLCKNFNLLMSSGIVPHLVSCRKIKPTEIIPKLREIETVERDYFTNEELDKIADCYENDFERLVFTIFLSIGLRINAVSRLKIKNFFEDDCSTVLETGSALEKAGKIRKFVIFPVLKQALLKYKTSNESFFKSSDYFLFPVRFRASNQHHINKTTIRKTFISVCDRANVTGDQVHTHACRKTIVVNLMKDGNTIDNVAKFIGHSNPLVTARHYWVTTPAELVSSMNISWLVNPILNPQKSNDDANTSSSSSTQGPSLKQIQKIAVTIAEGFKAQERLNHAVSLMSPELLEKMENMWNDTAKENVANKTKNIMIEIAEAATTFATRTHNCSTTNTNDVSPSEIPNINELVN